MCQKHHQNDGKPAENAMTARLKPEHTKGKPSCWPIQEELNDNPYDNGTSQDRKETVWER